VRGLHPELTVDRLKTFLKIISFFALHGLACSFASAVEAPESQIKATFLYNFAKFTEWSTEKLATGSKGLTICLLGEDPFRGSLDNLIKGKSVKSRPIEVRQIDSLEAAKECELLFVSQTETQNFVKNKQALRARPILTVGEAANFIDVGGQVQFFIEENKVRFEIDVAAVEKAGLKIDARVLNIAKIRREK
jgi:hypothetical protein